MSVVCRVVGLGLSAMMFQEVPQVHNNYVNPINPHRTAVALCISVSYSSFGCTIASISLFLVIFVWTGTLVRERKNEIFLLESLFFTLLKFWRFKYVKYLCSLACFFYFGSSIFFSSKTTIVS